MKVKPSLRNYLDSDGQILTQFLESGMGSAIGMPGLWGPARWQGLLDQCAHKQTIVFERGVSRVVAGFVGIVGLDSVSRTGELVFWCVSPRTDQTLPDSAVVAEMLNWCFGRLNLNRVFTTVVDGNNILQTLEEGGFVAEGVRSGHVLVGGTAKDVTVCGALMQSWSKR